MLRVLTIGHSYVVASNRAVVRELARNEGVSVTVAAPAFFHGDLRSLACEPEPPGSPLKLIQVPTYATGHIHVFAYGSRAIKKILREKFDLVHVWEEPYIFAGFQLASLVKKTSASFCFQSVQNIAKKYPFPFSWFERQVIDSADGWIANGELVRQALTSKGYPADSARVISLGVDTNAYRPATAATKTEVRTELGLSGPIIGFLGRLSEDKGIDVLLAAMERITPAKPWNLFSWGADP